MTVVDFAVLRSIVASRQPSLGIADTSASRLRAIKYGVDTERRRSDLHGKQTEGVLPIPLPPLAEQKRIVAKVDELMALCDRLEAQQRSGRRSTPSSPAPPSPASPKPPLRQPRLPLPQRLHHRPRRPPQVDPHDGGAGKAVQSAAKTQLVSMEELVGRANLKNGLSLLPTEARNRILLPSDFGYAGVGS